MNDAARSDDSSLYKEWRKTSLAADIPAILARFQSILIVFYGKTKGDPCHVGLDLDSTHYVHDVLRTCTVV